MKHTKISEFFDIVKQYLEKEDDGKVIVAWERCSRSDGKDFRWYITRQKREHWRSLLRDSVVLRAMSAQGMTMDELIKKTEEQHKNDPDSFGALVCLRPYLAAGYFPEVNSVAMSVPIKNEGKPLEFAIKKELGSAWIDKDSIFNSPVWYTKDCQKRLEDDFKGFNPFENLDDLYVTWEETEKELMEKDIESWLKNQNKHDGPKKPKGDFEDWQKKI